ncbi:MAG: PGF-pre-PGF domain-containing protein, partial [Nanoarchaeota archaeon]|nr:PGF-pre-PGF domain-containing protein [Nanoarchaeota archaeon]
PVFNITNYTGIAGAIFNITAFYNQTQNFTAQNATSFIIIDGTPPVFFGNKTSPNSPATYGLTCQFNITVFDETNISSVILEWNDTASIANYTVPTFSGSGSRNSTREYYYSLSNLSAGNHTYRWLANDSMNNTNSSQNFSYSIIRAASLSRLFLNGTENNRTYIFGEFANITALLNITGKNITVFANFSGSPEIIAGNNTSSVFNVTNTSNLNASSVYNITSAFSGDENYTASSVTYYLGLCPAACSASSESACSGGSKIVTTYSCGAPAYQCEPSPQTQSCSSGSSSGGGSIFAATVAAAANTSATISVTSYNGRITVSIPAVQANASEIINITNSSLPITKITISAAEKSANARIEIRNASAPAAQKPEGEVFRYFSIEKTNLSLSRTDVEFFVTKKWASENQINVSTIALNRLSGNWIRLPTLRTAEDSANFYFNSSVPGFSYFAITGEKIKTEKAVPQQLEVNGTANNETEKEGAEKTENLPALFSALVSIGILLIIAAACFAVYTSRRKKIKGDKDGAQEQE